MCPLLFNLTSMEKIMNPCNNLKEITTSGFVANIAGIPADGSAYIVQLAGSATLDASDFSNLSVTIRKSDNTPVAGGSVESLTGNVTIGI